MGSWVVRLMQPEFNFGLLNRRKGPAVQGPRAQADRKLYRSRIQQLIANTDGLSVIVGETVDLLWQGNGKISGVILADGSESRAASGDFDHRDIFAWQSIYWRSFLSCGAHGGSAVDQAGRAH
jgi:hypothetical protein